MNKKTFCCCYLLPALYMALPSAANIVYDIVSGQWMSFLDFVCVLMLSLACLILWLRNPIFNRVLGGLFALPVNYMLLAILSDFFKSKYPESYIPAFLVWTATCGMYVLLLLTPLRKKVIQPVVS